MNDADFERNAHRAATWLRAQAEHIAEPEAALKRLLLVLVVLVLVLALMQWAGFLFAATVAVALLMLLMGERRWLPVVLTSVGWSLFLWVLFDLALIHI